MNIVMGAEIEGKMWVTTTKIRILVYLSIRFYYLLIKLSKSSYALQSNLHIQKGN